MSNYSPRYDTICDPLDMWMVWDNQIEEPASFGGQIMHGLTEGYANEVAKIMNEIYSRDNDRARDIKVSRPTSVRFAG